MAISIQEQPWYVQVLLALVIAVALVAAGIYIPYSPVAQVKVEKEQRRQEKIALDNELIPLKQVEREHGEFQALMVGRQKELESLKAIVPEEKEVDEFIRLIYGAASSANVEIRRMTAKAINQKDYHAEMPFEVQCDGPYFAVLDFFGRLSNLSRIINVADLTFVNPSKERSRKYPLNPAATVTGTFYAVTFFTKGAEGPPAKKAGKQPGK